MDNNKIMIVGTGNVGASIAYAILNQRKVINEIVLTDIIAKDAEGEAMDLRDALAVAPSYVKVTNGTYKDAKDCDVVVITAGAAQKPGETRMHLLKKNANILKGMIEQIMDSGFNGILLVVSNPMDVLTYYAMKFSGLPTEKVIGSGTVLDSARLRARIANYLNVNPKSVHAYQIGEHGDTELTLWSLADIGGQPISRALDRTIRNDISDFVKNEAYDIIDKKGAWYATATEKVGQGKENAISFLLEHKDFATDVESQIRQKLFPGQVLKNKKAEEKSEKTEKKAKTEKASLPEDAPGGLF